MKTFKLGKEKLASNGCPSVEEQDGLAAKSGEPGGRGLGPGRGWGGGPRKWGPRGSTAVVVPSVGLQTEYLL